MGMRLVEPVLALTIGVVAPAFRALLVAIIGLSMQPRLCDRAAGIAAVFLAPKMRSANEEDALAVATTQLERRDDVVHFSSRMDENWTAPSPACILRLLISAIERRIT